MHFKFSSKFKTTFKRFGNKFAIVLLIFVLRGKNEIDSKNGNPELYYIHLFIRL